MRGEGNGPLTPLAPTHALTEIEHSPMLDDPPRLHRQAVAVHRDLEVRPIGKHGECRPELGGRIIGVIPAAKVTGCESRLPSSSDALVPMYPLATAKIDSISCSRTRVKPSSTRSQPGSLDGASGRLTPSGLRPVSRAPALFLGRSWARRPHWPSFRPRISDCRFF